MVVHPISSREIQGQVGRIEKLLGALGEIEDLAMRERVHELVQALLDLHGAGFNRMLEIAYETGPAGEAIIDELGADPLVSSLLLLHGLHPLDLETRVRQALELVKPRLGLHGGNVELLSVTPEGAVRLRLEGNCYGCPSSRVTLHNSIEEALYAAAPDVTSLEVEGAVANGHAAPSKFTECPAPVGAG